MTAAAAHIDFETRSLVDLKKRGLDVYANHISTEPLCLAFGMDDEPVSLLDGLPCNDGRWSLAHSDGTDRLMAHVSAGRTVYAHNAAFELAIWNLVCVPRYGWPELKPEQTRCTMAASLAMGLPGKLEHAAPALGCADQKDMPGHRVMMQLCRPRKKPDADCPLCSGTGVRAYGAVCRCVTWWDDAAKYQTLYRYCMQDVATERALHSRLVELSVREQRVWQVDHAINTRGIHVDLPAVRAALAIAAAEKKRLNKDMARVTRGAVRTCTSNQALTNWVRAQGVETAGIAKADVVDLLDDDALPEQVRAALLLRQEAAKASASKLDAIEAAVGADGRVRYTKQYHSATTGRWGGRRVQADNLKRPEKWIKSHDLQDEVLQRMAAGAPPQLIAMLYGPPMDVIANSIRAFIDAAPDCELVAADYSNIEGRGTAWLAGEEWKLEAFRAADSGTGPGIYELTYARSFNVDVVSVDEFMRQIGKVLELACGFGGGVGAFQSMARIYGVQVSDSAADAFKTKWREQHPRIVRFWYALETAAINAVLSPGTVYAAGAEGRQIKFRKVGSFLWMLLPSGRCLCYPYPKIQPVMKPWGELGDALTFMTVPGDDPKARARIIDDPANTSNWARISTYGGSLCENAVQASARDLLAEALVRVTDQGLAVVLHVHDEIVGEVPVEQAPARLKELETEMCRLPSWAAGLPVVAAGWHGRRYRKA